MHFIFASACIPHQRVEHSTVVEQFVFEPYLLLPPILNESFSTANYSFIHTGAAMGHLVRRRYSFGLSQFLDEHGGPWPNCKPEIIEVIIPKETPRRKELLR
jgi:hypothetical protein